MSRRGVVLGRACVLVSVASLVLSLVSGVSPVVSSASGSTGQAAEAAVTSASSTQPASGPVVSRPDLVSARLAAAAQGSRVEVSSLEDEYSDTYANPDGTLTTETSLDPLRVQRNGAWADVDYDLHRVAGGWAPKVSPFDVTFSDGGDTDAVSIGADERQVALSWAVTLPAPAIDGPRATYDLGGGESLVLTATPRGFEQSLVLASAPVSLPQIKLPLDTSGLNMASDDAGGFDFIGPAGALVYRMQAPVMYGADLDPDTGEPVRSKVVAASVVQAAAGPRLDLSPSLAWLTDPATVYPVTIDPSIAAITPGKDTYIQDNVGAAQDTYWYLHAGMFNNHAARAYMRFDLSTTAHNQQVLSATLRLRQYTANTCTAATLHAYPLTQNWATSVTWPDAKTVDTSAGVAASTSAPASGTCVAWDSLDVTGMTAAWASGALANYGLQLSGAETTGAQGWGFCSADYDPTTPVCNQAGAEPLLSVTYDQAPGTPVPAAMNTTPCASGCSGTAQTNTATPTLQTKINDPDGDTLSYRYQIWSDVAGAPGTQLLVGQADGVTPNTIHAWKVPAGNLTDGTTYFWRTRAYDGYQYGPYSDYYSFHVDTTAPAKPAVNSTTWSTSAWVPDTSGTISWTDASADVDHYLWSLDGDTPATTSATSMAFSGLQADTLHTLTVQAVDTAGNNSPTTSFAFGIGTPGLTSPTDGTLTQRDLLLSTAAPPGENYGYVYYQWQAQVGGAGWATIPNADLTIQGSDTHPTGATTAITTVLDWKVAATVGTDGMFQLRACAATTASGSSPLCQASAVGIQLDTADFGAGSPTRPVGPGQVSLLTGDFQLAATDVAIRGYAGGLGVTRELTTLTPPTQAGPAGVFGPGWRASLPAALFGAAEDTVGIDASYDVLTRTAPDGTDYYYQDTSPGVGSTKFTPLNAAAAADGSYFIVSHPSEIMTMYSRDGSTTSWQQNGANGPWLVRSVQPPAAAAGAARWYYGIDPSNAAYRLPVAMVAAAAPGVNCTDTDTGATQDQQITAATGTEGCRTLTFTYSVNNTANPTSDPRLTGVSYTAYNPDTQAMATVAVAAYDYDSNGRLADQWDPRITPALKTAYTYTTGNRLATITPPGQATWTLGYDSQHRLSTLSRPTPTQGVATTTLVYDVPLSGAGLPDLTAATTKGWDQTTDVPDTATAVFPPSHEPAGTTPATVANSDWPYAAISYIDPQGRDVNDAAYGAASWQITTTQYNANGNDVFELTAGNRVQALTPTSDTDPYVASQPDSAARAALLADISTYNPDQTATGGPPAGSELVDQQGPTHPVTLANGAVIDARDHTATVYDQGAPASGPYLLPTSVTTSALGIDGSDHEPRTRTTGYNPVNPGDASGWSLGTPTTSTDAGGITTTMSYDAAGELTEQSLPADIGTNADAGQRTTLTSYYTAAGTGSCVNPAFAGLECSSAPAAQPATGSPLPITSYSYDMYGAQTQTTQTYGTGGSQVVRTSKTGYDAAQRRTSSSVTVTPASAGGIPLPTVQYDYDPTTGLPTTASTTSSGATSTLATTYDELGEPITYTDATGNVSTTKYDIDGRPVSVDDGKGTTTYNYDTPTEHRGLITSEDIGVADAPSTFTATYDADGDLTTETYPNGLTAASSYNNDGGQTALSYAMAGTPWLAFTQAFNTQEQVAAQSSPQSSQSFTYDGSGRLTTTHDTQNTGDTSTCTTRVYKFDNDSNRTALDAYPDAGDDPTDGDCTTNTTPATSNYSYDQADRLTSDTAGTYTYDTLGRTLTAPAGDALAIGSHSAISGDLGLGYYANDMIAAETQGNNSITFTLDPNQDRIAAQTDGSSTITNHYSDDSDSPTWTASGTGWTRNLTGTEGELAATANQSGVVTLQLADLHGDIVATVDDDPNAAGVASYQESTEYGRPVDPASAPESYGWLGSAQRSSDDLGGLTLMGARLYNPATGRFLTPDPISGGNANAYIYPTNPVNQFDLNGEVNIWNFLESYSYSWTNYKVFGWTYETRSSIRLVFNRKATHQLAEWNFFGNAIAAAIVAVASVSADMGPEATIGMGIILPELAVAAGIADLYGQVIVLHATFYRLRGVPIFGWAYTTRQDA